MNDSNDELQEQATAVLAGEDVTWIERAYRTGFLQGLELLAVILYVNRDTRDLAGSSKIIIEHWSIVITKSVEAGHITARYPASFLPMGTKNINGWGWALSLDQADRLFARAGMAWTCSDLVEQLFNNYVKEASSPEQDEKEANEMDAFRIENKRLKAELKSAIEERDNASELFFGAIRHAFRKYDPAKRNEYLSAMKEALEHVDVPRDTDTIRKYLQIGYEKNKNARKPA